MNGHHVKLAVDTICLEYCQPDKKGEKEKKKVCARAGEIPSGGMKVWCQERLEVGKYMSLFNGEEIPSGGI